MKFRPIAYIKNLLLVGWLCKDYWLNTILAGDPMETYSERIGRVKIASGGRVPAKRWFMRFVDEKILEPLDKNHSIEAAAYKQGQYGASDRPEDLIK